MSSLLIGPFYSTKPKQSAVCGSQKCIRPPYSSLTSTPMYYALEALLKCKSLAFKPTHERITYFRISHENASLLHFTFSDTFQTPKNGLRKTTSWSHCRRHTCARIWFSGTQRTARSVLCRRSRTSSSRRPSCSAAKCPRMRLVPAQGRWVCGSSRMSEDSGGAGRIRRSHPRRAVRIDSSIRGGPHSLRGLRARAWAPT